MGGINANLENPQQYMGVIRLLDDLQNSRQLQINCKYANKRIL